MASLDRAANRFDAFEVAQQREDDVRELAGAYHHDRRHAASCGTMSA